MGNCKDGLHCNSNSTVLSTTQDLFDFMGEDEVIGVRPVNFTNGESCEQYLRTAQ